LRYIEVYVKTALSKSNLENTDYALNPYRGCEHRCVYCYSPFVIHMPIEEWNNVVYVKKNLPTVLNKELKRKRGIISIGTVTDAYQPAEKIYGITRKSLDVLKRHRRKISLLTKSSLILRDMDIIKEIPEAEVGVSITAWRDEWRRKIEPHASPIEERFQVLEEFRDKAITYAFIGPIFKDIILEDMGNILSELSRIGVSYVIFDRFRYKRGMLLPPFLESMVKSTDYSDLKRKIMRIAKSFELKFYFDW